MELKPTLIANTEVHIASDKKKPPPNENRHNSYLFREKMRVFGKYPAF